jgi:Ca-activated chloride channel family protein
MTFVTPLWLLVLLAIPLGMAWYLWSERGRTQLAEAFTAPALTASVTPHRPGWRRHAPMVAFALASALLIVAAARPRLNRTVTVEQLSTMLALDMSGSMQATDISPNRAAAAQHAADQFVLGSPSKVSIGAMQFNQSPVVLALPTRDRSHVIDALGQLKIGGGTAIGNAIEQALGILHPATAAAATTAATDPPGGVSGKGASAVIVLLSDGKSTSGSDTLAAARQAGRLHIPIFTVALGTPQGTITIHEKHGSGTKTVQVPPSPDALAEIAHVSGGQAFTAQDASDLSDIYQRLSVRLSHHSEERDITAYVVGAGILLLLLGGALSLRWFGRLI